MRGRVRGLSFLVFLAVISFALTGCGGGGSSSSGTTPPPPTSSNGLTLYPGTASVPVSQTGTTPVSETVQFTGYIPSQSNGAITWQVTGGSANGTIDSTGKYTAPTAVPSPAQVAITATSGAFTGTATVTITAAQGLAVTPAAIAVPAGTITPFTVTGATGQVTWQVSASGGANPGVIDANGNYSAPLSPPPGGTVTITAINGAKSGTATATIVYSNASLSGPYAFSYTGDDGSGFLAVVGSFVANGNGNITSGIEDVNSFGGGVASAVPLSGTYTVGADGRTQATVTTGLASGIVWQFALLSNQHGLMIRFDLGASGSGTIDQQNPLDFSVSAINSNYTFGLAGLGANGPLSIAGLLYTDGLGDIPLKNTAVEDINYSGTTTTASSPDDTLYGSYGFYNLNTGRGWISLTNTNTVVPGTTATFVFTFYMVDSKHLKLVESDAVYLLAGDFFSAPNTDGSFSASILKGNYAFTTGGASSSGPYSSAGILTANGGIGASSTSGNITGVFDVNDAGNVNLGQSITSSTYNVDPNLGRITFTLTINKNTLNFAAYPTSTGSVEMIELDANPVASGIAYSQTPGATVQGSYALNLSGVASTKNGSVEQDVVGQVATSTGGTLIGTIDINNFLDHGISEGLALLNGTAIVSPDSNGRGTLTLKTSLATFPLAYYIVDDNTVLLFETDSLRVMPGTLVKQF